MATVIIFGLEVHGGIKLSVLGPTGHNMPPLIVTKESAGPDDPPEVWKYKKAEQRWEDTLQWGKYVIRIEELVNPSTNVVEEVDGAVAVLASPSDADSKCVFVSRGKREGEDRPLNAWQATAAGSDPKDPWPPPTASIADYDTSWFEQEFARQDKATKVVGRPRGG